MAEATVQPVYQMPYEAEATDSSPEGLLGTLASHAGSMLGEEDTQDADEQVDEDGEAPEAVEAEAASEEPEDEEGSDEEPEEPAEDAPQTFKAKVDGEEVEVTLDELLKGYSRTADYTRKTQALSEERKAFLAQQSEVQQVRDQYGERLARLDALLQQEMQGAEPDWDTLRAENPNEFAALKVEWRERREELAAVQAERQRVEAQQAAERQQAMQSYLTEQRQALLEKVPEWKDEAKASVERAQLREFAHSVGFTDEDLATVTDHRLILLLRDASRGRQMAETGRKALDEKKAAPTRVLQPGPRVPATKKDETRALKQRLAQTGHVRDAAALFERLLPD